MKRIAALALTVVTFATASAQNITINETQMRKLQQAEFFIKNNYVDNLEDEKIVDAAIEGMLKQLDPHSTYIKAKDVEKTNACGNQSRQRRSLREARNHPWRPHRVCERQHHRWSEDDQCRHHDTAQRS